MNEYGRPLFVFDGECVLCSRGVRVLMRCDRKKRVDFTSSTSPTGAAAYARFGLDPNETYLLLDRDRPFTKSDGYLHLCTIMGGYWRLLLIGRLLPRAFRDWVYDRIAKNRYRWFGRTPYCALLSAEDRGRLIS